MRLPSPEGLVVAALFFGASMTPSLVPRSPEMQGILGGLVGAVGYGSWWTARAVWTWLGLRGQAAVSRVTVRRVSYGAALAGFAVSTWLAAAWQNSIRIGWGLPPVESTAPVTVGGIALAIFLALLLLGRLFLWISRRSAEALASRVPVRLATVGGFVIAVVVLTTLLDGVLMKGMLRLVDVSSRAADTLVSPDIAPPDDSGATGSAQSLVAWEDLGRWGRGFVASGPDAEAIGAFWGAPAREPIRVYVGLTASGDAVARARLAFEELLRTGGFEREVLVVAVPTGSGWLDPGAQDTLEFMHRGDVATVAVQYSYLASWISILVDPSYGLAESRAIFDLVYGHWTTLPPDARPRLYLHGLSLGAFLSQSTVPLLDVLGDPFDGAMWAGSPFLSEFWRFVVERRDPESPAWRPRFGNGSLIRTTNQDDVLDEARAPWGPIRLVFLQYASDPIVFFDVSLAFRRPDWLTGERGPDVSPDMRWIPIVTMLQLAVDMGISLGVPGFGHDYIAEHYIPAWAATTRPAGWTRERERALRELFRGRPAR